MLACLGLACLGLAATVTAGWSGVAAPASAGEPTVNAADAAAAAVGDPGPSIPDAFSLPPAKRLDPYGPRRDAAPRLSIGQVTRFALENPLVKASEQKIEAMQAQLRKAKWAWFPLIETTTTLTPGVDTECDDVVLDDGTPQGFDFQFCRPGGDPDLDVQTVQGYFSQLARAGVRVQFRADIVQPLLTFGKIKNLKRAAKAGVALAKLGKLQARQETVLRVQQAYAVLLLARESQLILREAKAVVDKAQKRVNDDLGDPSAWDRDPDEESERSPDDRVRVEIAALDVQERMREALKAEALARSALWALAGRAAPPGFAVAEAPLTMVEIDGGLRDLGHYRDLGVRHRPEARMAAGFVELRRAQEKLARANFLPDLGLAIGVNIARSSAADNAMRQLYYQDGFNFSRLTAALSLRWKWDFHNKAFDLQKARAQLREATYQREAARLLLMQDVDKAYQELTETRFRVDIRKRHSELAWRLVISQEQKDTIGAGDARELLRALERWYNARFDYLEAIQTYNTAVARLSRAVGTALDVAPKKPR